MNEISQKLFSVSLKEPEEAADHEYYMSHCLLAAKRSKDPCSQVGACLVDRESGKIISIGYNGMPRGCDDDIFPWTKEPRDNPLRNKHFYVCHAEMNAIMNTNGVSVDGKVLYATLFPCNECAKLIIQSGIEEVIYLSDKHAKKESLVAAKRMFDLVGIKYWQFRSEEKICIDFEEHRILRNV